VQNKRKHAASVQVCTVSLCPCQCQQQEHTVLPVLANIRGSQQGCQSQWQGCGVPPSPFLVLTSVSCAVCTCVVCVQLHGGMHATSPADSWQIQPGHAPSCHSETRVGGPYALLYFTVCTAWFGALHFRTPTPHFRKVCPKVAASVDVLFFCSYSPRFAHTCAQRQIFQLTLHSKKQ
jgi:hypothetical protein